MRPAMHVALALALLISSAAAREATPQEPADPTALFQRGVEAFRDGDPESARALWLEVLEATRGLEPAPLDRASVLYDLGNAAFRLGQPIEAAAWYTACIRLDPRRSDAWANLELARSRAELDPADRGDLVATLRRALGFLTLAESEWLVLAAAALLLLVLLIEAVRGGLLWKRLALVFLLLLLLAMSPWVWRLSAGGEDPLFVLAADGVSVRSEPRADAAAIERLEPGEEVERVDELPGWARVELSGGERGWVPAEVTLALVQ